MNTKPTCKVPDCGLEVYAKGWCLGHYHRHRRGSDMNKPRKAGDLRQVASLWLRPEHADKLVALAGRVRQPIAAVARRIVEKYFERKRTE